MEVIGTPDFYYLDGWVNSFGNIMYTYILLVIQSHTSNSHIFGAETTQSTIFAVHLGTAETNPTDSTFNFNRLWIILIWRGLQLALTINVLERETFNFDTLRTFQSLYFITFAGVKKLNQDFYFWQNLLLHTHIYNSTGGISGLFLWVTGGRTCNIFPQDSFSPSQSAE